MTNKKIHIQTDVSWLDKSDKNRDEKKSNATGFVSFQQEYGQCQDFQLV